MQIIFTAQRDAGIGIDKSHIINGFYDVTLHETAQGGAQPLTIRASRSTLAHLAKCILDQVEPAALAAETEDAI